jgi:hypothetical protein
MTHPQVAPFGLAWESPDLEIVDKSAIESEHQFEADCLVTGVVPGHTEIIAPVVLIVYLVGVGYRSE